MARGIDGARSLALIALALTTLGACVSDDAQPTEIHVTPNVSGNELATLDLESYAVNGDDPGDDLCGMAAELPLRALADDDGLRRRLPALSLGPSRRQRLA
ncbi:MAG: hypothetical protein IPQ07_44855 [Myxococcales bacterium]|nr:hypothetical protein [Myxococcales bacterium]